MRQQDPRPRQPRQPQPPTVPFDPNDPSTWPKATPSNLAQLQAKAGYKPLTGEKPATTPWYKVNPFSDENRRYDLSGKNMYNASGTDALKFASNLITGAADLLIDEPVKSAGRTLSTQNIQTAINPKSTATQRINAIGEDIINIASIVPSVRSAASALEAASMARYLKRLPAIQAEQRVAWDAYDAALKEAYAEARKLPPRYLVGPDGKPGPPVPSFVTPESTRLELEKLKPDFPRPPDLKPTRYELARQKAQELRPGVARDLGAHVRAEPPDVPPVSEPNIFRAWHTNPEGLPLPERLNTWESYYGVDEALERRGGNPQGNMLSSGFYNTDGRLVSGDYGNRQRLYGTIGYKATGSYLPLERTWAQYGLDDFINVNTPISQIDEFKGLMQNTVENPYGPYVDHPFLMRERNRLSINPTVPGETTKVIDAGDFDISKWNFGGKNPEDITVLDLLNAAPNEDAARAVIMASKKPIAATRTTRTKYPLFKNPGGQASKVVHGSEDMPAMLIESGPSFDANDIPISARSITYKVGDKTFIARPRGYKGSDGVEMFPGNAPFSGTIISETYPGQNYFDLPIKKNTTTGAIEEVGGMKALDLGKISQKQREEIVSATESWLKSLGIDERGIQNQDLRDVFTDLLDRLKRPEADARMDFYKFKQSQDDIQYLVNELTGSKYGKDQWYKMLKDDLGYEAFPHPGGITIGGGQVPTHQAMVINSPEKLPPRNYVPPVMPRDSNEITAERINEYIKQLATARMLQPGKTLSKDFSGRVNKQILNLAKRGAVSPINTYAQNLAGNR